MQVNNNSYNWNSYDSRPAATQPSATSPTDAYTPTSSSLTSLLQQDPQLAQEWSSLSPDQQQEVEQLFNLLGGSSRPTGESNGNTAPVYGSEKNRSASSNSPSPTAYGSSSPAATTYSPTSSNTGSTAQSGQVYGAQSVNSGDPSITLKNNSSQTRYYYVEASAGQDPQNLNGKVIAVPPGGTATVNPGVGFNGAITDNGTNSAAGSFGTRMEYNAQTPGQIWYDADTERGNTNATFGPTDGKNADDGRAGTVGNDLSHYFTHGAVAGQTETAADKQSDLGTHVISGDAAFTLTSTD